MHTLTQAQISAALAAHSNNNVITVAQMQQLLQNVSVTFAQITTVTQVQLAAQHKAQNIQKVTCANVMLASNLHAHTQLYARAVRKSAANYAQNNAQSIAQFEAQSNYFAHTATHCIVVHKQHANKFYLYAIYNNARSAYVHNNAVVTKQHVAAYCTASKAAELLQQNNTVHNKTHNIVHNVQVRTIALANLVNIRARKQFITV